MAMGYSYRETDEMRKLLRAVGKALPLSRICTPHQPRHPSKLVALNLETRSVAERNWSSGSRIASNLEFQTHPSFYFLLHKSIVAVSNMLLVPSMSRYMIDTSHNFFIAKIFPRLMRFNSSSHFLYRIHLVKS
jgi:hypothetical protein